MRAVWSRYMLAGRFGWLFWCGGGGGGGSLPARSLPFSLDESSANEKMAGGLDRSTTTVGMLACGSEI